MTTKAIVSERAELLKSLEHRIAVSCGVNWVSFYGDLQKLQPNETEKKQLAEKLVTYILKVVKCGAFKNFEGMQSTMQFLQIEAIEFSSEWIETIADLMSRFSVWFLFDMTPSLYDGMLPGGTKYEPMQYTRNLLIRRGLMKEEDITDDFLQTLWDAREVMVQLHDLQSRGLIGEIRQLTGDQLIKLLLIEPH
jgi:hypothetical protein